MSTDPQGAADQRAHDEWMDGEGADCMTSTGIWHAALAWERARVRALEPQVRHEVFEACNLASALVRITEPINDATAAIMGLVAPKVK